MLTQHIALVAEADAASAEELAHVSAAIQRQVTRDLGPVWAVSATVDAFTALEEVPIGYWPLVVSREPLGAEQGVHLDRDGQPYARVEATLAWSLDASRACLEMLVDPFGSRTTLGVSPRGDREAAEVLVEVCAPCAGLAHGYVINDVIVSDFCTPAYFGATDGAGQTRYSVHGAIDAPLRVLPGGHLTWYAMEDDTWWTRSHHGDNPIDTRLGALREGSSVRDLLRERAPLRPPLRRLPLSVAAQLQAQRSHAARASRLRAERLRGLFMQSHLAQLEGSTTAVALPAPEPLRVPSHATTVAGMGEPIPASVAVALEALEVNVPSVDAKPSLPPALPSARDSTAVRPSLPPSLAERTSNAPRASRPDSLSPHSTGAQARPTRRAAIATSAIAIVLGGALALLIPVAGKEARNAGAAAPAAAASVSSRHAAPPAPPAPPVPAPTPAPGLAPIAAVVAVPSLQASHARRKAPRVGRSQAATVPPKPAPDASEQTTNAAVATVSPATPPALADLIDTRK